MNAPLRIPNPVAQIITSASTQVDQHALHKAFRWLRAKAPLAQVHCSGVSPFWIVTKYADIREISRQNNLFLSGERPITLCNIETEHRLKEMSGRSNYLVTLLDLDDPDHRKSRYITQGWFMSQSVRRLEERVAATAKHYVDRMQDLGDECDFAQDIGQHYSLHVLLDALGIPQSEAPYVLQLTQELLGAQDPDLSRSDAPRSVDTPQMILEEFWAFLKPFTEDRRANPADDLLSILANGCVDGELLGEINLMGYFLLLMLAGHDSTSFAAAGGMMGLCEFPGEFAKLRGDLALARGVAEEAIRWTTPVRHFMRSATMDYELRGQKIRPGDWLMLAYPSGNRDEEVFDDPDTFRIDRNPNPHLAFGYGAHLCLGQHLAKLEMTALFQEIGSRLKTLEAAGPPAISETTGVGGPKRLPIRYEFA